MNKSMTYLPEAFITKGKKRIKQFAQNVYLSNGDNYEIELFNPTQKSVLAKVKLDGDYISMGGIVIHPGERIFLERFLETNNKFVFNTYNVDSDSEVIQHAIKNNGKVSIEFYNQSNPNWYSGVSYTTYNPSFVTGTTNNTSITFTNTSSDTYHINNPIFDAYTTNNASIETGRTERGESSNQSFVNSNEKFEYFTFYTVNWQILPNSEKVYTKNDIKRYCGDCGSKIKKSSYRFCPHCGSELE